MTSRIAISLLATAGALSLAACRIDTPTGDLHSDRSDAFAAATPAAPYPAQAGYAAQGAYPGQAAYAPGAYGGGAYGQAAGAPVYDGYALAERAHAFDRAVYRRRPTYAFRYGGEQPLVWRTADDWSMYAEPVGGGYRDYYYAPEADHPYFVRDARYGYGYGPDGRVVAVYDAAGELLPSDVVGQVAALAADYFLRARTLRRYGVVESYRIPVSDDYWAGLEPTFYGEQPWLAGAAPGYGGQRSYGRAYDRQRYAGGYGAQGYGGQGDYGQAYYGQPYGGSRYQQPRDYEQRRYAPRYYEQRQYQPRYAAPAYPREVAGYAPWAGRDNGRHLGWYKHEAQAWGGGGHEGGGHEGGGPQSFAVASAQPNFARGEGPHGGGEGHGGEGHDGEGHDGEGHGEHGGGHGHGGGEHGHGHGHGGD